MDRVRSLERQFNAILEFNVQAKESAKHEFERQVRSGWNRQDFNIVTNSISYMDHHLRFQLKNLKEDQNQFAAWCGKFFSRL
jgi:hypothetical protein